jgi:hypothetical protein
MLRTRDYQGSGSLRSTPRRAVADPTPIAFTSDMAWTIVMFSGRTRPVGRYIRLPDIGVGVARRSLRVHLDHQMLVLQDPLVGLDLILVAGFNQFERVR